jgi:hypothetical protein
MDESWLLAKMQALIQKFFHSAIRKFSLGVDGLDHALGRNGMTSM